MNEKQHTEILVGIFLLIGIISITFLALRMGDFSLFNNQRYIIKAEFTSASGLKKGAHVEMAGVSVGRVTNIDFNPETITFEEILEVFWKTHDPTTLNQQGADKGTQYRSAIYYNSEEQQKIAKQYKEKYLAYFENPIVFKILSDLFTCQFSIK